MRRVVFGLDTEPSFAAFDEADPCPERPRRAPRLGLGRACPENLDEHRFDGNRSDLARATKHAPPEEKRARAGAHEIGAGRGG